MSKIHGLQFFHYDNICKLQTFSYMFLHDDFWPNNKNKEEAREMEVEMKLAWTRLVAIPKNCWQVGPPSTPNQYVASPLNIPFRIQVFKDWLIWPAIINFHFWVNWSTNMVHNFRRHSVQVWILIIKSLFYPFILPFMKDIFRLRPYTCPKAPKGGS